MRALSVAVARQDGLACDFAAWAIRSWLRPLQALIASPSILFLLALAAMLFSHPDVPFHRAGRFMVGLVVLGSVGRALVLKKEVLPLGRASWPMMALMAVVLISLIDRSTDDATWGVLVAKYVYPFTLFHLAQVVFTEQRDIRRFEIFVLAVLAYLSFTAIVFLLGARALVFPKFILDPSLGSHVARARGPFLQAVPNGVSLNILALLVLHGYRRGTLRSGITLAVLASVPIAILATMTRAVWLSFAGSLLGLGFLVRGLKLRLALVAVLTTLAAGLAVLVGTTQLGGALSDRFGESSPVEYRKAVYAGGWDMFRERPVAGWGFHQMPAELPRYVDGFREKVLYPHNTYLEVLVENGLLGLALYAWLMWELWRLGRGRLPGERTNGLLDSEFRRLWPILLAVYWVNAAVVVMSYQFVNGTLFTVAGILAAQNRRAEADVRC